MIGLHERGCAVVTGASRGIGAACARALAGDGWPVIVNFRADRAGSEAVVEEIEAAGGRAAAVRGDVTRPDDIRGLLEAATDRFGPPLVLVNNAGNRADGLAVEMSDEAWESIQEVNLEGPFRLCRAVLPRMVRARFGRIVNVSSIFALRRAPGQANYAASKAGLVALTKALAAEVGRRGVTVNAVAPGYVKTELASGVADEVVAQVPMARWGTPDEVAACARFLASEDASYVTGATLVVDGGLTA
ncbi:MAG: 3-oxoacyl-ACP reductase FabG [Thermoleophilaceae bacterium]|nr:3-oxoacyl-ACP reductase FabG [Thermoleophilaceae bacterium]